MNTLFTKSDFTIGMECPKHLWLIKHHPEMRKEEPMGHLQLEGMEVGRLAGELFGSVTVIPYSKNQLDMIEKTNAALADGDKVIAEAAIRADDLYCRVDYLEVQDDGVIINEVKSSDKVRKIRTRKKVEYEAELLPKFLYDCAFQYYVLLNAGFNVKQVNCVHPDQNYIRQGKLEYDKLFVVDDVTDEVKKYVFDPEHALADDLRFLKDYVSSVEEPGDAICSDCRDCEMAEHCWRDIPSPNVWDLNGTFTKKRDKWYENGLVSFESLLDSGELPEKSRMQVEAELYDKRFINSEAIRKFLENIYFPLYFLDFETYMKAVPEFDGQWPYEQVPFQYSLHIMDSEGAPLEHKEFLGKEGEDPRRAISERLVEDIPMDSCVTAYNKSFECTRLKELSKLFPDLAEHLTNIADHIVDFEVPFKQYDYCIRDMHGMSTIKKVLPALFPDDESLNYHNLPGVQNGAEAMDMFLKLRELEPEERERQREYMLKYCGLDTYAMVKVYEALYNAALDQ